jgi:hypothetical protein
MAKRIAPSETRGTPRVLGHRAFAAISAVEGLKLSREGRKRVENNESVEHRRSEILRAYVEVKRPR